MSIFSEEMLKNKVDRKRDDIVNIDNIYLRYSPRVEFWYQNDV